MAGRPRSVQVDAQLADAVASLLAERGYAATTVDAVAQRSGVAKTAIYRRWPTKAEMVFAVVVHHPDIVAPDTGSLPGDVLALSRLIVSALTRPAARAALPGLLDGLLAEPVLAQRFRHDFIGAERRVVATVLDQARARGELVGEADPAGLHALLLGNAFARTVLFDEPEPDDLADQLARTALAVLTAVPPHQPDLEEAL